MSTTTKFQASLSGYLLWAWERLLEETGEGSQAEMARMVFREWLNQNSERVAKEYGISRDEWKQATGGNVKRMSASSSRRVLRRDQ